MSQKQPQQQPDHMDTARHLLAGIESDIRGGEAMLAHCQSMGVDHFSPAMSRIHEAMDDATLDGWTRETQALINSSRTT